MHRAGSACARPSSPGLAHDAMSPAPTNTVPLPAAVWKFQVGPVIVDAASLTVAYHS